MPDVDTLFRPTFATIDLGALAHNFGVLMSRLQDSAGIMAMVKADAYGHGAVQVSKRLSACGVKAFGVATVEEGMELTKAGIREPILVMGGLMGAGKRAADKVVALGLIPVIHSRGALASLEDAAKRSGTSVTAHLKVDTGMSRLGVMPASLRPLLDEIRKCGHVRIDGVMTHLASADDAQATSAQMESFISCRKIVEDALGRVSVWHAANSTAILTGACRELCNAGGVWVRPGLALYGEAEGAVAQGVDLKPVMSLESRVVLLKSVPAGARVSYGGTFTARRPTRLAIVPIGYADGYPWSLSGKASVLVRGTRAPVAGRVTMDMIVVDVTDIPDCSVNDEVVLMGTQGDERVTAGELARLGGTIVYEIFCGISKRMPRIYKDRDS